MPDNPTHKGRDVHGRVRYVKLSIARAHAWANLMCSLVIGCCLLLVHVVPLAVKDSIYLSIYL